jgi:hypothetical protein
MLSRERREKDHEAPESLGQKLLPRCSAALVILFFFILFSTIVLLVWVISDVGIADRVVLTSLCIPLIISAAVATVTGCGERRNGQ